MKDMNLNGLKDIKADKKLIERTVKRVMSNGKTKRTFNVRKAVVIAASVVFIVGAVGSYGIYNRYLNGKLTNQVAIKGGKLSVENTGIKIPAIEPGISKGKTAKMVALVVYKGKVYTQSATELPAEGLKNFLGDKIGKTVNIINEWNVKDKSSEEMASNIGEQDIYKVKGYDDDFRIMSYSEANGESFAQLFDCLNGITVKSGKDVFGKLKLEGNVESAKYISFDDWNNGKNNYKEIKDLNLMDKGLVELNEGVPFKYQDIEDEIDGARNNDNFRQIEVKLKDGCQVKLNVFKNGYVSYGISDLYFKVDKNVIDKLW